MELSQGGFDAKYGGRGGTVIHCGWLGGTWRYRDNIHVSMRYAGFILTMSIPMLVKHEAILYICRFNEKSYFPQDPSNFDWTGQNWCLHIFAEYILYFKSDLLLQGLWHYSDTVEDRLGKGSDRCPNFKPDRPAPAPVSPNWEHQQTDRGRVLLSFDPPMPLPTWAMAAASRIPDPPNLGIIRDKTSSALPLHSSHPTMSCGLICAHPFVCILAHPLICIFPTRGYLLSHPFVWIHSLHSIPTFPTSFHQIWKIINVSSNEITVWKLDSV